MPEGFQNAAYAAMGVCALMVVFNLLLIRKRGVSALLMAASFVVFGGILYSLTKALPEGVTIALSVLLAIILFADFAVRAARKAEP